MTDRRDRARGNSLNRNDSEVGQVVDDVTANGAKRRALIFVPGISRSWGEQSLLDIADDLVSSLDRSESNGTFVATAAKPLSYGQAGRQSRSVTITRIIKDDASPAPVIDLYELDYARSLANKEESRSVLRRAVNVAISVFFVLLRLLQAIRRPAKTGREKGQLLVYLLLMSGYVALLVVLFLSLAVDAWNALQPAIREAAGAASSPPPTPLPTPLATPLPTPVAPSSGSEVPTPAAPNALSAAWAFITGIVAWLVTGGGLVLAWLLLPPKDPRKEAITNSATDLLAGNRYLDGGEGSQETTGALKDLISTIRRTDPPYERIDLASYSLGSIVAFNVLFPPAAPPETTGPVSAIHTFVTIGSPYDLVRLLRQDYFDQRGALPSAPKRWLNVYSPNDLLGSNFRNDGTDSVAETQVLAGGIPTPENIVYFPGSVPANIGLLERLLGGFRQHALYWDRSAAGEHTCFDPLAAELYGDLVSPPA